MAFYSSSGLASNDSDLVHRTAAEIIAGIKRFTDDLILASANERIKSYLYPTVNFLDFNNFGNTFLSAQGNMELWANQSNLSGTIFFYNGFTSNPIFGVDIDTGKYQTFSQNTNTGAAREVTQEAIVSTNFKIIDRILGTGGFNDFTTFLSDGTDPNGVLTGEVGDICYNAGALGISKRCSVTGTTWV